MQRYRQEQYRNPVYLAIAKHQNRATFRHFGNDVKPAGAGLKQIWSLLLSIGKMPSYIPVQWL